MTHLITAPGTERSEGLSEYRACGGYSGLAAARARGVEWTLAELDQAGLRGRGGGGQGKPAAPKWRKVARAANDTRYVIANGAEGSPASRKDRHLMELFPHRVLDGLLTAAFVVGAETVYWYVRGDAAAALAAVETAVGEAQAAGLFGPGDCPATVVVKTSRPTYISGEETAVIDALEGQEGSPQSKPPYPEDAGLHGCPTVVSNVETLAAAAAVLRLGADAFAALGTPECPGTALFTVSGDVAAPGVYEVPYGTTLRALLDLAGAPASAELEAVLPGGLSAGPLRPDELDVPLTYEALAELGSSIGSASPIVFRKGSASLAEVAQETAIFLAEASCGQCHGCKDGTRSLAKAFAEGKTREAEAWAELLYNGRGNCGHPAGAARFALRALTAFADQF